MASNSNTPLSPCPNFFFFFKHNAGCFFHAWREQQDPRTLTEWACVVSDVSDARIGAVEKEVGDSHPGILGAGGQGSF